LVDVERITNTGGQAAVKMASQPQEVHAPSKAMTSTCNVSLASCIDPITVPNCGCGEPAGIRTSQTVKNPGRQFFGCRKQQEDVRRCAFFQWCDTTEAKPAKPAKLLSTRKASEELVEASELQRSGSGLIKAAVCQSEAGDGPGGDADVASRRNPQCFECGQYGHLARECTFRLESLVEEVNEAGANDDGVTVCFKCHKPGHWAADCPLNAVIGASPTPEKATGGDVCFKCNQSGHWARECPLAARNIDHLRSSPGNSQPSQRGKETYPCLRCGQTGHWAKDCTEPWRDEPIDVMGVAEHVPTAGTGDRVDGVGGVGGVGQVGQVGSMDGRQQQPKIPPETAKCIQDVCFKCNQPGHWASECPQNSSARATADVNKRDVYPCLRCGKTGHWAQNCTQPWREEPLDVVGLNTEAVVVESALQGSDEPGVPEAADAPDDPDGVVDKNRPSTGLDSGTISKPNDPKANVQSPEDEAVDLVPIPPEKAVWSGDVPEPPATSAEPKSTSLTASPAPLPPPSPRAATDTDSCAKRQARDAIEMPPPKNPCVRQHTGPAIDVKKLPLSMRGGGGWDVRKD
jgi:hypothetical protein